MSENLLMEYLSDEKEIAEFLSVIKDMSNIQTQIEAHQDYIKEAKTGLKENYEVPLKIINLVFKLYHTQKAREYFESQNDVRDLYETLFGSVDNE
jgi:hypothetical protein